MAYKKLEGIIPFNEMLLKSCYYHQMAAAYTMFGVDPPIIVGNYLPIYQFNERTRLPEIVCREILKENEVQKLTGVQLRKVKTVSNFNEFIVTQINNGNPVLVLADCFYLDYRDDAYLKKHISHYILIYGYDSNLKKFILCDHEYLNSYKYAERLISMGIIETAHARFVEDLMKNDYSLIVLSQEENETGNYKEAFKAGIKQKESDLKNSFRDFKIGIEQLKSDMRNKNIFERKADDIITFIGEAKISKNAQKNIIGYFGNKGEIYKIADRILEDYIFIYGVLSKMNITKRYNEQLIDKIQRRCEELISLEKNLLFWLLKGGYE